MAESNCHGKEVTEIKTRLISTALLALCLLMAASPFGFTYPVASLTDYNPDTFTYTYTVNFDADDTFPFGHFRVFATVPNAGITGGWVTSGPTVGGQTAEGWTSSISRWSWQPAADYAAWQASTEAEVFPGADWVGIFTLVAPNTEPVQGMLYTSDGPGSEHYIQDLVPGPATPVPEPSSMITLITGSAALLGLRKKRSSK